MSAKIRPAAQAIILAVIVPLALAALWFGRQDGIPPQEAPRSSGELARLEDRSLVAELAAEVAHRMYAKGFDPSAWRRLDGPPLHLWVVVSVEGEVMRSGLARFLAETPASSLRPGMAELARAYREIGLAGPAVLADEAARRLGQQSDPGRDALFYADLQARLAQQLQASGAPRHLIAYGRRHLAAFAEAARP
jgi:hypothetical protein